MRRRPPILAPLRDHRAGARARAARIDDDSMSRSGDAMGSTEELATEGPV